MTTQTNTLYIPGRRLTLREIEYLELPNGCWLCTSHKAGEDGYTLVQFKGRRIAMHRYIYTMLVANGVELPSAIFVRHLCNNTRCINPAHLSAGNHKDNMNDKRLSKIDHPKGKKSRTLWWYQAKAIRDDSIHTVKELAEVFHVSIAAVRRIKNHKTWNILDRISNQQ